MNLFFDGNTDMEGKSKITVEKLAFVINRGGWPATSKETDEKIELTVAADYVEAIANEDISKADGIEKNPERVKALMRSLSRNISGEAKATTILNDLITNDEALSQATVHQVDILKHLY